MPQDIQQWLAEIQALKQRLSQATKERTDAYQQAYRWQQSYQTEAEQRRKDIKRLQTVIYTLDQRNKQLKQRIDLAVPAEALPSAVQPLQHNDSDRLDASLPSSDADLRQVEHEVSAPDAFQQKLSEAIAECDRLSRALAQEQAEHHQTRETLMTALSDTMEQLERERKQFNQPPSSQPPLKRLNTASPNLKTPLPGPQQKPLGPNQPSSAGSDPA